MWIVPGAAVRSYVRPAVDVLTERQIEVRLLPAPGEPGVPADLGRYGAVIAGWLAEGRAVDLLIGLSVGSQVVAAASGLQPDAVRRLVLVSPTVDPQVRTVPRLLFRWLRGGRVEQPGLLRQQAPEWRRAGVRRLATLVRSSVDTHLEDLLPIPALNAVLVHAQRDVITSHNYAARLAADHGAQLIIVPGATHSWPYQDFERWADTVMDLLR